MTLLGRSPRCTCHQVRFNDASSHLKLRFDPLAVWKVKQFYRNARAPQHSGVQWRGYHRAEAINVPPEIRMHQVVALDASFMRHVFLAGKSFAFVPCFDSKHQLAFAVPLSCAWLPGLH